MRLRTWPDLEHKHQIHWKLRCWYNFNVIHSAGRFEQLILSWISGESLHYRTVGNRHRRWQNAKCKVAVIRGKILGMMLEGLELGEGPPCDCEKTDICNKIRRLLPHQGTIQRQKENLEDLKKFLMEGGVSLATKICIGKGELKTVFRTVLEEFPNGTGDQRPTRRA